ncbi:MAG: hypothetical protein MJ222_05300 [Bacilli bacterium]|nr:hypothetical protein [Bacilli bacterium]
MRNTTKFRGNIVASSSTKKAVESVSTQKPIEATCLKPNETAIKNKNKVVESSVKQSAKMAFSAKPEYGEAPQGKLKKAGSSSH